MSHTIDRHDPRTPRPADPGIPAWPGWSSGSGQARMSVRFLAAAMEHSKQPFYAESPDGGIIAFNEAFRRLTGYEAAELERMTWLTGLVDQGWREFEEQTRAELLKAGDPQPYSLKIAGRDGNRLWVEAHRHRVLDRDGRLLYYCTFVNDITSRKIEEEQLLFRAFHDALTGLPNRSLLLDRLRQALESARRHDERSFSLVFVDLDDFKAVNDIHGHFVGDQVLNGVSQRIRQCLRNVDTLARLGGDEFAILLDDARADEVRIVAERIVESMSEPFLVGGHAIPATVSIGVVDGPGDYERPEQILRDADSAMYRSKALGKARCTYFARKAGSAGAALLADDLRHALERNEFILHYQPVVTLKTGRIVGFEALLRWVHPLRGLIEPAEFLDAFQDLDEIMEPVAAWVLREACCQLHDWSASFPGTSLFVSVNLAREGFSGGGIAAQVEEAIRLSGLDRRRLKLEVQKRAFLDDAESMAAALMQLKELDIQVAIDDFVIGYPTLSQLQRYSIVPIDAVKIDRSVVSRITTDEKQAENVWSIAMIAQSLGMDVVAKGIETRDQVDRLIQLKCEYGQGYYFSRPVPSRMAETMLQDRSLRIPAPDVWEGDADG